MIISPPASDDESTTGRVKRKVVPLPSRETNEMLPPERSITCLTMARPRPVPCSVKALAFWARKNSSKRCSCASAGMPMPVSSPRR